MMKYIFPIGTVIGGFYVWRNMHTILYNSLYCFSWLQIKYERWVLMLTNKKTDEEKKVKEKEKEKEKYKHIHYALLKNKNVLQTQYNPQHKSQHKSQHSQLARFFSAHDFQELNKDSNLTPSNVRFLSINLTHNDKTYEINLKTDEHDFHVEHMKLNASFFHYYLTQVLKVEINENENDFQYTLTIIDDNVNVIEFTHHDYIVLLRDECFIKQHVH